MSDALMEHLADTLERESAQWNDDADLDLIPVLEPEHDLD